ncbi:MAG: hypothetical protein MUE75_17805 [Algoriphagus sp.]|jgi:hypothetical protein|nr:hypothetical protein [Algoriphagus sp.]
MEPKHSKESILRASLIKQQLTIADFEQEMSLMTSSLMSHDESASQDQKSNREQNDLLVRMEGELLFLKNELLSLETIDPTHTCEKVEHGAVVVTDQRIFFISSSIESLEVNGQSVFGLSVHAPIYAAMKDKKKGDLIESHGLRYAILDIY